MKLATLQKGYGMTLGKRSERAKAVLLQPNHEAKKLHPRDWGSGFRVRV